MSRIYRKYMKLLEKWPVDPTKKNRDLGEHIRLEVRKVFGSGANFSVDEELCENYYLSLKRISDDHYLLKYPRKYNSSGSDFKASECNAILSDEFIEYMEKEEPNIKGFMRRMKDLGADVTGLGKKENKSD